MFGPQLSRPRSCRRWSLALPAEGLEPLRVSRPASVDGACPLKTSSKCWRKIVADDVPTSRTGVIRLAAKLAK